MKANTHLETRTDHPERSGEGLWSKLLGFEIARVRKYADECMKNVATAIKEMTEVTTFQYGPKEQDEVAIVKLHA
jgi:hypothetical protein